VSESYLPEEGLESGNYVLMVARFVPENTVAEFFEAAPKIAQTWKVVIVGSSGFESELDQAARSLSDAYPDIKRLGHLSDDKRLFALWQHAGVYFHGHSVGGTNPALVQAMTCGSPTVARDTPYNREVLGENGVFVDANSARIVEEISALMRAPEKRAALGVAVTDRAESRYSWGLVNGNYEALLSAVADRRSVKTNLKTSR
jgi:glycosyltransferase involved in cell wall biosynthesis